MRRRGHRVDRCRAAVRCRLLRTPDTPARDPAPAAAIDRDSDPDEHDPDDRSRYGAPGCRSGGAAGAGCLGRGQRDPAAAATRPARYFLVDDGTGTDDLAGGGRAGRAADPRRAGRDVASNAEALSAGRCGPHAAAGLGSPGQPGAERLYVGDIGDNASGAPTSSSIAPPNPTCPHRIRLADHGARRRVALHLSGWTAQRRIDDDRAGRIAYHRHQAEDMRRTVSTAGSRAGGRWSRAASSGRPALSGRCGPSSPATWRPTWRRPPAGCCC